MHRPPDSSAGSADRCCKLATNLSKLKVDPPKAPFRTRTEQPENAVASRPVNAASFFASDQVWIESRRAKERET